MPFQSGAPHSATMPSVLDTELIPLLRCPVTKQPLRLATDGEKQRHHAPQEAPALITEDGTRLYRTEMDLPILLSANDEGGAVTG
jgi:uncharacterized protein YbaR (Trm112 family)